jgi:hypothetical protein
MGDPRYKTACHGGLARVLFARARTVKQTLRYRERVPETSGLAPIPA